MDAQQEDWLKRLGVSMERVMCRLIMQEENDLDKQEIGVYDVAWEVWEQSREPQEERVKYNKQDTSPRTSILQWNCLW